jgi:hypothetical protein
VTYKQLLEAMCPMGVFSGWSHEELVSQVMFMLRVGRQVSPRIRQGRN